MRKALLIAVAFSLVGCTTRIGDLTVASPKNLSNDFNVIQEGVEGKDCAYQLLLLIPLGVLNPTVDGAIDNALEQVSGADALTDASIYNDILFTLLFNSNCIRITGTAISTQ